MKDETKLTPIDWLCIGGMLIFFAVLTVSMVRTASGFCVHEFKLSDVEIKCSELGGKFHVLDNINGITYQCFKEREELNIF